jgi:hypothetical protein
MPVAEPSPASRSRRRSPSILPAATNAHLPSSAQCPHHAAANAHLPSPRNPQRSPSILAQRPHPAAANAHLPSLRNPQRSPSILAHLHPRRSRAPSGAPSAPARRSPIDVDAPRLTQLSSRGLALAQRWSSRGARSAPKRTRSNRRRPLSRPQLRHLLLLLVTSSAATSSSAHSRPFSASSHSTVSLHLWSSVFLAASSASRTAPKPNCYCYNSAAPPPRFLQPRAPSTARIPHPRIPPSMRCHQSCSADPQTAPPHHALPSMASPRSVPPPPQYLPPLPIAVGVVLSSKSYSVGRVAFFIFSSAPEVSRVRSVESIW